MSVKEELHKLIEHDALRLLSDMRARGGRSLARLLREAEEDEASEDELAALAELDDADRRVVSHDEIRREFAA